MIGTSYDQYYVTKPKQALYIEIIIINYLNHTALNTTTHLYATPYNPVHNHTPLQMTIVQTTSWLASLANFFFPLRFSPSAGLAIVLLGLYVTQWILRDKRTATRLGLWNFLQKQRQCRQQGWEGVSFCNLKK